MALVAHNLTANRKTGEKITVTVPIYSSEPGDITASASGCTFPDGDTVTIAGTRTWRNGLKHGQYLARANCLQARDTFALFIEIELSDVGHENISASSAYYNNQTLLGSIRQDQQRTHNWSIQLGHSSGNTVNYGTLWFRYLQSNTSAAGEAVYNFTGCTINASSGKKRFIITANGTEVYIYWTNGTSHDGGSAAARTVPTGTVGGQEVFFVNFPGSYAKLEGSLPTQAQREAFMSSGTLPSGLAASYQGGHEIVESAPRFWDTSGNNLDLSDVDVPYWPEAAASGDYTDDPLNPVVPASSIRVTIPAGVASPVTLSLSRPRAGVPSRATDEERFETTTGTITLVDVPTEIYAGPAQHVRSRF